jgi:nucleoside-diphosphate-sugar epimerase
MIRKWNLWGYVDARDAAQAVRKALESKIEGAEVFTIANADTVMLADNAELLGKVFPNVPLKGDKSKKKNRIGTRPCSQLRKLGASFATNRSSVGVMQLRNSKNSFGFR